MPKITAIVPKPERQRYWIYVDGKYCTSVRERTLPELKLSVGQEISCEEIETRESHVWKNAYGRSAWEKEKVRLGKVKTMIENHEPRVEVKIVGYGADSNELIEGHPEESGKPDLEVITKHGKACVLLVEVTGTEYMRGSNYWVRPDKLKHIKNHPEEDVWLILHFANPHEKFVFIRPDPAIDYPVSKKKIHDAIEYYVEFADDTAGVTTEDAFVAHLEQKVNSIEKAYSAAK